MRQKIAHASVVLFLLLCHFSDASACTTTSLGVSGNLDATAPLTTVPPLPTTFDQLTAAASYSTFSEIVDAVGKKDILDTHTLSLKPCSASTNLNGKMGGGTQELFS